MLARELRSVIIEFKLLSKYLLLRGNFPLQTASQINLTPDLHSLAAEVGIDWDKAQGLITWDGHWKNNVPALSKSYEGRVSLISNLLPNGTAIITFRTFKHGGKSVTWKSDEKYNLNRDPLLERRRLQAAKHAKNAAKSKADLNQQYISLWKSCSNYDSYNFPYLDRKGIIDSNLKLMAEKNGREFLAVPLINKGQIVGLQRIYQDGYKKLTPGATLNGSYYLLGAASLHDITQIYITEGWATAKTVYELTGIPTICAFSAENLKNIADMLLQYTGVKNIVIAADNDQFKNGNAGLLKALEISYRLKIKVRFPNFNDLPIIGKPTDFNDLLLLAGPEETLRQLTKAKKSILRSAPNALEFRLKKLSFSPAISSPNNKLLKSTIAQAMKKGLNNSEIITLINKFTSKIPDNIVRKSIFKVRNSIERRVSKCHQINPKKHPNTSFIDLPLNRAEHGGYLIDDGFYDTIKGFDGIVIVKSPMGSGKTEQVISKALKQSKKACYITHRISLTEEGSERLGIDSYRDVSKLDMYGLQKLGCCINSLNSFKFQRGDWFLDCDLIAIDEGTKVLSHLSGNTVDDPEGVANTLLCAINLSKQVVICDADANDTLVELIENLTDKKVMVAQSSPKIDHIDVTLSNIWDGFAKLFEDAQNGKTVLCACDSKNDVKKIKRKLDKKGLRVLGIHSESKVDPDVEKWTKNPSKESKNWDVIAYNSTIDSGVSVVSDHFDVQIGIFRGIISPQTVMQMMGRNRTAREWFIACSPIVSSLFGDDPETRYKALAASAMKVKWNEKKVIEMPQKTSYDSIKLAMTQEDIRGKQDYFLTLATMLSQKGYQVKIKKTEEEHIKELKKELAILGEEIKDEFISLILNATTPQPHRYRKLKQAYAVSEEELAEIIRYEIRHNLGTYTISEEDILFWLENYDRRELWFEILKTKRDKLLAHDKWEAEQVESLTRRKHLVVKADIIQTLFKILSLDRDTGKGCFTHKDCSMFIDYLQANKNRLGAYNQYKIGPHLFENSKPGCPTRFVVKCLEKLGLKTTSFLTGKKRLACHSIDIKSWQVMTKYYIKRKEMGLDLASIPKSSDANDAKEVYKNDPKLKSSSFEAESLKIEPSRIACLNCSNDLDPPAIKWQFDRCSPCQINYQGIT